MPDDRRLVVVIGAGPAGIAAACAAAAAGGRVALIDQAPRPGGQIWRHRDRQQLDGNARRWLDRLDRSAVTFRGGCTVFDLGPGRVRIHDREGAQLLVPDAIVLATGARERYLPFPGWTLPGVLGIGGLQALAKQGASLASRRVVLAGSGPLMLPVSAALVKAGAQVLELAEQAPWHRIAGFGAGLWRDPGRLAQAASARLGAMRSTYRPGTWVSRVEPVGHTLRVHLTGASRRVIECDLLGTGFGLVPNTELAELAGCATAGGVVTTNERQETSVPGVFAAGELTGIAGSESALIEGCIAGGAAAGVHPSITLLRRARHERRFGARLEKAFELRPELAKLATPETIACRCEDVRMRQLTGLHDCRDAKLMTRAGMGACQGRVCGPALQHLFGWAADRHRPPAFPVPVSALSGSGQHHQRSGSDATT